MAGGASAATLNTQVCIYGGNAGGVAAAVQASRLGLQVVLVEPTQHLGGLTTGGLGATDVGSSPAIGGMAREFYNAVRNHYVQQYGADSKQVADSNGGYRFEPSVAEMLIERWLEGTGVRVVRGTRLESVDKAGARLTAAHFTGGTTVRARVYIDTTYEGDLFAAAGVSYHVGREGNDVYGESLNGIQHRHLHQFEVPIDPYIEEGNPASGLLWGISPEPLGEQGTGDRAVQAYNYRMCLTKADDRLPIEAPEGYDPTRYALLARYINAGVWDVLRLTTWMPNGKTDTNNYGAFSTDYIGGNHDYPEADWQERERIIADHRNYQQGMMYFLGNDPSVPERVRTEVLNWGLPRDEFQDNGGWPRQLYIREARRMIGPYVMTEANCRGTRIPEDSIGLASYTMDSHNCRRIVVDGIVRNEGDVQVGTGGPYAIAYDALTPRAAEADNLLVPVCLSSTHIAFGSIRMEPVFMITGQSAATAAWLAIRDDVSVQAIDRAALRERLLADNQVLDVLPEWRRPGVVTNISPASLPGQAMDESEATLTGDWLVTAIPHTRLLGRTYLHDGNTAKGECTATFELTVEEAGRYQLLLLAQPNDNRARNVPVTIVIDGGAAQSVIVNQRDPQYAGRLPLGEFELAAGTELVVTVSNRDTDGHVVIDGLHLAPVEE